MVRLGAIVRAIHGVVKSEFQFQLGTIGRLFPEYWTPLVCTVSIPAWYDWEPSVLIICIFCPKVSIPAWYDWEPFNTFQSTNLNRFQFQLGTIGRGNGVTTAVSAEVSIPAWYDWERYCICFSNYANKFQFQLGTIGSSCQVNFFESLLSFNSSLVRLGVLYPFSTSLRLIRFNSSLVRLGVVRRLKKISSSSRN